MFPLCSPDIFRPSHERLSAQARSNDKFGVTMTTTRPQITPAQRFSLDGTVAIVTGGSRGIGLALSHGLADAGARVVVASRSADHCQAAVDAIISSGGVGPAVATDNAVAEDRARLIAETISAFGRLDILVNNAGVLKPHHTVKVTEAELDNLIAVNLKGPVFLSQAALPHLEADGGGSIINISALGAFQPMAGIGAYCAVKAAMVNWTSTMAKEWTSRGVRVNSLVPGPVATEMILPRDPAVRDAFVAELSQSTLVGRLADPEDLVGAVMFLASPASVFMTGRSMFLDGGMLQ
jgi:NAD(P)-dependent dehydrogenase (short-subunit alcohol dehydrogenase family)